MLRNATSDGTVTAARARTQSERLHRNTGRTAGNGSLMRTAPVALAYLDDEAAMVEAARVISELTHWDPLAGDFRVLWCSAIRHAVLTGQIDVRVGLRHLPADRRADWAAISIWPKPCSRPTFRTTDSWQALQGAWSAIHHTPEPVDDPSTGRFRADRLRLALEAAVRGGRDTDTAADRRRSARAAYGASAVPLD